LEARENQGMPTELPEFVTPAECASWLGGQRNDLQRPALTVAPEIEHVLNALSQTTEALFTRMSGSGSTCFALYPTMKAAHFAAYEIGAAHPDWWCRASQLN
ncbi:MAG: 4-(cytidine 5'-diphospho)-2-C-methyl-D-erythritol kinase, partial [Ruegeria sp.]